MHVGQHAIANPHKAAVISVPSGAIADYRQLDSDSRRLARAFQAAGLQRGDRVAVAMGNHSRFLAVCWAARRAGLFYVPLNWHLTDREMLHVVENSGSKALVADDHCREAAAAVAASAPNLMLRIAAGDGIKGFASLDSVMAAQADVALEHEAEGVDMIYTSGTTGLPKGGSRPLRDVDPAANDSEVLVMLRDAFGLGSETRLLIPGAPLYHAAPLRFAMSVLEAGGTVVLMDRFDAETALRAIEEHRVDVSQWVPTMFVRLLRLDVGIRDRYDLSAHQAAIHGAAPCAVSVKESMIRWWGPILDEYYGASEGGTMTTINSVEWLEHPGSVGLPVCGKLHILDGAGNELPIGQPGVIYVEDGVPITYLDDEEKTRDAYTPSGWTTVGDMGYLDEDGYLYLTDRRDSMIISGGVNIYPQEIENVLIQNPMVFDVAVIGVPNEEFGQEVKAVVRLEDSTLPSDAVATELRDYCRAHLASYKCPATVDFVEELPRSEAGKLYKRRLMDRYWGTAARRI